MLAFEGVERVNCGRIWWVCTLLSILALGAANSNAYMRLGRTTLLRQTMPCENLTGELHSPVHVLSNIYYYKHYMLIDVYVGKRR